MDIDEKFYFDLYKSSLRTSAERGSSIGSIKTYVDVGAHKGGWTDYVAEASYLYENRHHLFEANPDLVAVLEEKYKDDPKMSVIGGMVHSVEGLTLQLGIVADDLGRSSAAFDGDRQVPVASVTLDGYCARSLIEHLDYVKIDAEGNDMEVIAGAKGLLDRQAIDFMQFEYGGVWAQRTPLSEVTRNLQSQGYAVFTFNGRSLKFGAGPDDLQFRNILAVKEDIWKRL